MNIFQWEYIYKGENVKGKPLKKKNDLYKTTLTTAFKIYQLTSLTSISL